MAERKSEAIWIESRSRWQINVQDNGVRKTFTSAPRWPGAAKLTPNGRQRSG